MRPLPVRALLALLAALLAAACTSGDRPSATAGASETPSQTATPTSSPAPAPTTRTPFVLATPTPDPRVTLAATVWLADLESGTLRTLVEFLGTAPYDAEFTADGVIRIVSNGEGELWEDRIDAAGNELDDGPLQPRCVESETGAQVGERIYLAAHCGSISPNGERMTYAADAGEVDVTDSYSVPSWDQWVVDLESGIQRRLQAGLRHCGGCDFRYGARWSPSGRFLVVPELLDGGDVYLFDLEAQTSRNIAVGRSATLLSSAPVWAPDADRLLRPGAEGSTILEDLDAGTSLQLDELEWPAAFDPTGAYAYAPAWADGPVPEPEQQTTVVDAATGAMVGRRPGVPSVDRSWGQGGDPIVATGSSFVAALGTSEGCEGVLVYDPGRPEATCLEGAVAPVFSPDTKLVAFARESGRTPPSRGPQLDSVDGLPTWEISVFDRETGEVTVVAEDAVGRLYADLTWNHDGTKLLIRWPNVFGI